jgi:hypothetical protein
MTRITKNSNKALPEEVHSSDEDFESWQTAEDVMVLPCDFTAVCHDSKTKKSTRQSFVNFQENLNEGK